MTSPTKTAQEEKHICQLMMEYAMGLGARKIDQLPGLWESKIDDQWTIKCNGHTKDMEGVPAFCWSVEFNGWPAGIMSIRGEGVLCAGDLGNEDNLRKAIQNKMQNNGKQ